MTKASLNEVSLLINQKIQYQDYVHEHLSKAEAVASVALTEGFLDYEASIVHTYLWALCDMISAAKNINEQARDLLLKEAKPYQIRDAKKFLEKAGVKP